MLEHRDDLLDRVGTCGNVRFSGVLHGSAASFERQLGPDARRLVLHFQVPNLLQFRKKEDFQSLTTFSSISIS